MATKYFLLYLLVTVPFLGYCDRALINSCGSPLILYGHRGMSADI